MHFVAFVHPSFLPHQSMPRYARMLVDGLNERGHTVEVWAPEAWFFNLPAPKTAKKWLGYLDQYVLFPRAVRARLRRCPPDTFFIVTDNALGPWVPLIANRPHVVHCHDFMAQRSALGEIPENQTSWTGRRYQAFIRRGYAAGRQFICVSEKTKDDLLQLLPAPPARVDVVYNSLNEAFQPVDTAWARTKLGHKAGLDLTTGYLLHVGGNVWYKNRVGVIELYDAWRSAHPSALPLLLVGEATNGPVAAAHARSPYQSDIHVLTGLSDEQVRLAYAGALLLLFPSLSEGFGWPIIEAMSMGCPVLTTNEVPMTEVAGQAAFLAPRRPANPSLTTTWASGVADTINRALTLCPPSRQKVVEIGLQNAQRFDYNKTIDHLEQLYTEIAHA